MNHWILLIIAVISILPLPIWVVKRANLQRPYKAVLLLAFALTGALLYATYSGYFSAQISEVLFAAGVYGAITCATTLVFMLFGIKREGFTAQYEQLERDRWQAFEERKAESVSSRRDDEDKNDDYGIGGFGSDSTYTPGRGYGYGSPFVPGQGYGHTKIDW